MTGGNHSFPQWQIWSKPLSTTKYALLLINLSPDPRDITVNLASLQWNMNVGPSIAVRDVWTVRSRNACVVVQERRISIGSTWCVRGLRSHTPACHIQPSKCPGMQAHLYSQRLRLHIKPLRTMQKATIMHNPSGNVSFQSIQKWLCLPQNIIIACC